ncbi:hypothetical protein MalM25_31490 [Planctomycetes bacterium MalM25]|nr:hypothetical protein MalM25_31490 [Planctomycetes bacterium MalM25]
MNANHADGNGSEKRESLWEKFTKALLVAIFLPLLLILLPIVLLIGLLQFIWGVLLVTAIRICWAPHRKDTLVVYSNSPHWQHYFESVAIPSIGERCFVINWSERKSWPTVDLRVIGFRWFSRGYEFNPIVIVFKPFRWPRRFRFYKAMRDAKHNNYTTVRKVAADLSACLEQEVPPPLVHPQESA